MSVANPILSVIIPCFNDGQFLPTAVESARISLRGSHEIIIVNDGSTDPMTLSVLDEMRQGGLQVVDQKNRGLAAARNRGITVARGRYILPLDSDNRIRPTYIDHGVSPLEANPDVDVVYGDAEFFGSKTGRWRVPEFNLARLLQANFIDACAVFRKAAWERCGGYDENMPVQGHEDWDLWIRIACSGGRFLHLNEVVFEYRVRAESMSAEMLKPDRLEKVRRYINNKCLAIRVEELARQQQSWDAAVLYCSHRPLRAVASLLMRTYFPGGRKRLLKLRGEQVS